MQLELKQFSQLEENKQIKIDQLIEDHIQKREVDEKGTLHVVFMDLDVNFIDQIITKILHIV